MNYKVYRYIGEAVLPIVTIVMLSGPIHIEYLGKVPHWKEPTFYQTHEHTEPRRTAPPKLNVIVSGTTITTTSIFTTNFFITT